MSNDIYIPTAQELSKIKLEISLDNLKVSREKLEESLEEAARIFMERQNRLTPKSNVLLAIEKGLPYETLRGKLRRNWSRPWK